LARRRGPRSPPRAKFHPHRCNVSPLRGEKPQNRPLSKLNTGRFALLAMLPVTRSTGTVQRPTSVKASLTSVGIRIWIRIPNPDRYQNLTICSLAHCQPFLKISCKSVLKFLRRVANRQTDRQANNDVNNLLGGGNKTSSGHCISLIIA